uniref:Uncharacterized protein n=1 Tax=Physcomitrium patens TaxID=3218 RepID=A0A7I4DWS5_PHYPA
MRDMAGAAQVPTSFGRELRVCLLCSLMKTYDQENKVTAGDRSRRYVTDGRSKQVHRGIRSQVSQ